MVGERLAEIRKDHGDTQQELADKLQVTKFTVSNWEQEKSEPYHEILVKICRLYGVSADYLLGLSDVDPAYAQRRRQERFTAEEEAELRQFEAYLLWKRNNAPAGRKRPAEAE